VLTFPECRARMIDFPQSGGGIQAIRISFRNGPSPAADGSCNMLVSCTSKVSVRLSFGLSGAAPRTLLRPGTICILG